MRFALLALAALLQAGGVTPGRSCERGARNARTTGVAVVDHAPDIAMRIALGALLAIQREP